MSKGFLQLLPRSRSAFARVALSALTVGLVVFAPAQAAAPTTSQAGYDGYLEENNRWAIDAMNLPAAWETTRGAGVTVAVVDTGMSNHPFFEDRDVLPGYSVFSSVEEDAWHDRAPNQIDDPDDTRGHGTGVSAMALLAAPEATILPVRDGTGDPTDIGLFGETEFEAIRWAADNGADVIVMAWGVCCSEPASHEEFAMALQYAIDQDVVLAAAAGNDEQMTTSWHFPAAVPGVVTVGGLGDDGNAWGGGTTGPELDVVGPADYSLWWPMPEDGLFGLEDDDDLFYHEEDDRPLYFQAGGTSSAVGWIGGVLALIRAAHPEMDASNAVQQLIQTAADHGPDGRDDVWGYGVPDAAAAVTTEIEPVDHNPLGYPLALPGASGVTTTGEPAPGTGATPDGAAGSSDRETSESGGSKVAALMIVAALAGGLAGGAWLLVQRRAGSAGSLSASAAQNAVMTAIAVALMAGTGAYIAGDTFVSTGGSASGDGGGGDQVDRDDADDETGDGGGNDEGEGEAADPPTEGADDAGELAADGNPAAMAAQAWQDAYTAGDLETFLSLTCENPWYRVAMNIMALEDPDYQRPGFALLVEGENGWDGENYRLERQSETRAWVGVGNLSVGSTYEIALVQEDGEWKVCDFWMTGAGWLGIPEWEDRWPPGDDDETTPVPT